jgi:TfoX/Sxy family transcriptional regulator of competence genes
MSSKQHNVEFVLEQMSAAGNVSVRKMFGEYAIYSADKVVALFCDDQLFLKPTDAGRAFLGKVKEAPPYPGAKPYFLITGDCCEDGEWLSELVRVTERALPKPKPKLPRKSSKSSAKSPFKTPRGEPAAKAKRAKKPARRAPRS